MTSMILLAQPVATIGLAMRAPGRATVAAQLLGVVLVIGGIAIATVPIERLRDRWSVSPRPEHAPTD